MLRIIHVGVEVKAGLNVKASELAGLRDLAQTAGNRFIRGIVLYLGREVLTMEHHITAMPLTAL
ncbi:MAG: hypothetical protein ACP5QA_02280 [Phycisphaerae bacterium]